MCILWVDHKTTCIVLVVVEEIDFAADLLDVVLDVRALLAHGTIVRLGVGHGGSDEVRVWRSRKKKFDGGHSS